MQYKSLPNVIFPQISRIFESYVYYIAKNYLPLLQQIADSLKKIGLVGTLLMGILHFGKIKTKFWQNFVMDRVHQLCNLKWDNIIKP